MQRKSVQTFLRSGHSERSDWVARMVTQISWKMSGYQVLNGWKASTCKQKIPKDVLRMARMMKSRHHDGVDPNWFHFDCFWPKAKGWGLNAGEMEKIKGVDALRFEDQERVEKACNAISDIRNSFESIISPPSPGTNCPKLSFLALVWPWISGFFRSGSRTILVRGSLNWGNFLKLWKVSKEVKAKRGRKVLWQRLWCN